MECYIQGEAEHQRGVPARGGGRRLRGVARAIPVHHSNRAGFNDILNGLQGVDAAASQISAVRLRQMVAQGLNDPSRVNRMNRPLLYEQLGKLAQLTIAIQFDLNSARIRPDSFKAVGLMADALYHPICRAIGS